MLSNYDRLMLYIAFLLFVTPSLIALGPLSLRRQQQHHSDEEWTRLQRQVTVTQRFQSWLLGQAMKYVAMIGPVLILLIMPSWYANILWVAVLWGWVDIGSEYGLRGYVWMTVGLFISILGFVLWHTLRSALEIGCL